jgi:hypothetical protein
MVARLRLLDDDAGLLRVGQVLGRDFQRGLPGRSVQS